MSRVYITYRHMYKEIALRLEADLEARGIDVFLDASDLALGANWAKTMRQSMEQADAHLILLAPEVYGSQYIRQEIGWSSELGIPQLPVRVNDQFLIPSLHNDADFAPLADLVIVDLPQQPEVAYRAALERIVSAITAREKDSSKKASVPKSDGTTPQQVLIYALLLIVLVVLAIVLTVADVKWLAILAIVAFAAIGAGALGWVDWRDVFKFLTGIFGRKE
jgi:hypothetical protein